MEDYNNLFDYFSPGGQPIPGSELKEFFLESGLTTQQLGEIWDMSDIDRDGRLDRPEFASACSLVKAVAEKLGKPIDLMSLKEKIQSRAKKQPVQQAPPRKTSAASTMWDTFANLITETDNSERRYREMFKAADTTACGYLTGDQAKPLLAASRLPRPVLARIWSEVDPSGSGRLSLSQFISAMRACEQMKVPRDQRRPSLSESARKSQEARRQMEMRAQEDYTLSQRRVINERLANAQREQEALKASIQAAQYESVSLEDKVNQCRTKLDSLNRENEVSQQKTVELQQQCATVDAQYERLNAHFKDLTEQLKNRVKVSKQLDATILELEERNRQANRPSNAAGDDEAVLEELTKSLESLANEESQLRQQLIDTRVKLEDMKTTVMTLESATLDRWTKMDESEERLVQLVNKAMEENSNHSDELLTIFNMTSELIDIDLSSKRPKAMAAPLSSSDPFQEHDPFADNLEDSNEWVCEKDSSSPEEERQQTQRKKNLAPPLPTTQKLYPQLPNSDDQNGNNAADTNLFPDLARFAADPDRRHQTVYGVPGSPMEMTGAAATASAVNGSWQKELPLPKGRRPNLCRALYDFQSDISGDLRFVKNDIIVVDDSTKKWWTGHIGSRRGNFPSNYVETVELTNKAPDSSKGEYMVRALFHYRPGAAHQHNDLTFDRGDLIKVLGSAGDSWVYGQIGSDRFGMLPANYVQRI